MLCKWQVKKLCIFNIQISSRDVGGVGWGGGLSDQRCLNHYRTVSSLSRLIISLFDLTPPHSYFPSIIPSSSLRPCFFLSLYLCILNLNLLFSTQTHTSSQCVVWTWPPFVNILPLDHPLRWYNDHFTVRSKARRKLGRRQQRGQQHWSNYVSLSPSILTLMKSLIVRGRGRWGGEDRCTKYTLFIYLILWNERKERRE